MRKTLLGVSIVLGGALTARAQSDVAADKAKLDALYDGAGVRSAAPQGAFGALKGIGRGLEADYRGHDWDHDGWDHGRRGYGRRYDHDRDHERPRPIIIDREPRAPYDRSYDGGGKMSGTALAVLGAVLLGVILLAVLL